MKLQIKCVSEARQRYRRTVTVFAEQENLFEIEVVDENGAPQDKAKRAELLNLKDGDRISWTVLEEDKETVLFSKESPVTDQFSYTIPKKLSGEYYYAIQAYVTGRKEQIDELRIKGYCEPKVLQTSIESDSEGDLRFGHIVTVLSEAEGVNGNNIKVEIYNEKDICVANLDTICREGDIRREGFDTMGWQSKCKDPDTQEEPDEYKFTVRIKDREEYVKDSGGNIDVFEFVIKNKNDTPGATVDNKMIATVNEDQTDLSPKPQQVGILTLESVLLDTKYTVTNDEDNDKKIDHWILKDGNGKDCHWAKSEYREAITQQNIDDEKDKERKRIKKNIINNGYKPNPLPVMLPSTKDFKITAWFKVVIPFEVVSIRLTDDNQKKDRNGQKVKYTFNKKEKLGGKKDELFPLEFKSLTNPYANQVQYFKMFELSPEYSLDGEIWEPMEKICFELYITWKDTEKLSTKIPESLLKFACEYASNCDKEEEIVEKAFFSFDQKGDDRVPRTYRVREGKIRPNNQKEYLERNFPEDAKDVEPGMGYWRGVSTQEASVKSGSNDFYDIDKNIKYPRPTWDIKESAQFLIRLGEARCGEWTYLFIAVLYVHGITSCSGIAICTDLAKEKEPETFKDYIHKTKDKNKKIKSHSFAVKDYTYELHPITKQLAHINLPSIGQGNPNAQPTFIDHIWCYYHNKEKNVGKFYDPSYATICEASIKTYCKENLTSIHIQENNKDDVVKNNIENYIWANKQLF